MAAFRSPPATPDPIIAEVTSGGSVDVSYLGGECTGYAAASPDFSILWTGPGLLRFYFVPSDPSVDTALVVNDSGMNWHCNGDWQSGDTAPMVDLESASDGRIDVWVASTSPGEQVSGTLYITQLTSFNPSNPGEGTSWEERQMAQPARRLKFWAIRLMGCWNSALALPIPPP
jgi:hypothetical protein